MHDVGSRDAGTETFRRSNNVHALFLLHLSKLPLFLSKCQKKKMERLKSLFKSTREQTDLESKPLEEWSTKDFQDWLKEHDYQKKVLQSK